MRAKAAIVGGSLRVMAKSKLIEAAMAFLDWEKPWMFHPIVLSQLSQDSEDQLTSEDIWVEACRPEHWQYVDITRCCVACHDGLKNEFSWLPEEARAQFVRATSFQWK